MKASPERRTADAGPQRQRSPDGTPGDISAEVAASPRGTAQQRAIRRLFGAAARAGNPVVQRAMYLDNQDDLIYKDSKSADGEYAFIHKSDKHQFYIRHANVGTLQTLVAGLGHRWRNERDRNRWFDDIRVNAAGGDTDAQKVLATMGRIWADEDGTLVDVTDALSGVVVGHLARTAATTGALYHNVGGGSRLPRGEGMLLVRSDWPAKEMIQWLGVEESDLAQVAVHRLPKATLPQAVSELTGGGEYTSAHEISMDSGASGADMIYLSRVKARRSLSARVRCAGANYQDDLADMGPEAQKAADTSFNALPAVTSSTGWVAGTTLVAKDRGRGQLVAMKDWNALGAAAYANKHAGRGYDLKQNWEWLHVQGAQIGGATTGGNLVAGLYATNSLMIPFENMVARWAQADAKNFEAKFDATPTIGGFASKLGISIRARGHFALGDMVAEPLVTFDPLHGSVVDKVAGEFIKRKMDRAHKVT